jgi:hypothetical protein
VLWNLLQSCPCGESGWVQAEQLGADSSRHPLASVCLERFITESVKTQDQDVRHL